MKRWFGILIMIALLLTSCAVSPEESQNAAAAPEGTQDNAQSQPTQGEWLPISQASLRQDYLETTQGIYYTVPKATGNSIGGQIHFLPKNGTQPFLLCGKPNCAHMGDYCNAWGGYTLAECGGKIYTERYDWKSEIIRMNPDGTDHETVCDYPTVRYPDGSADGSGTCFAAGDQLLVFVEPNLTRPFEDQRSTFFQIDLQTGEVKEAFASLNEQYHLQPGEMRYAEGKLYCHVDLLQPDGSRETWMAELDPKTDAWRMLFPIEDYFAVWAVYGNTLYYLVEDTGFREYDLTTGETVDRGLPVADAKWASYDEDYVYLMGHDPAFDAWAKAAETQTPYSGPDKSDHTLYILTRDYELIDQVFLPDGENLFYVTDDYLYFCAGYYGADCRLEKSQFGSGNLTLEPLK